MCRQFTAGGEHLSRPLVHAGRAASQSAQERFIGRKALLGVANRRLERLRQRHTPIVRGQVHQCRGQPGDSRSERTVARGTGNGVAFFVQVHVFGRLSRGSLAAVDHHLKTVGGPMQQEEAAAPEPRSIGFDHAQGGTDRNRRVKGIAAPLQNRNSCFACQRMRARHRGSFGRLRGAGNCP